MTDYTFLLDKPVQYTLDHVTDVCGADTIIITRSGNSDPCGVPACCGMLKELERDCYRGRVDIDGESRFLEICKNPDDYMLYDILSEFDIAAKYDAIHQPRAVATVC